MCLTQIQKYKYIRLAILRSALNFDVSLVACLLFYLFSVCYMYGYYFFTRSPLQLLAPEICHEENALLQCVRHITSSNFLSAQEPSEQNTLAQNSL